MNVIGCQLDIVWENKPANHDKVLTLLDRTQPRQGSLVVLPEMFATGFSMNVETVSDSCSRETQEFLAKAARDYRVYLLGGVVTTDKSGRGRNESVLFSPEGSEVARYCKMHPFTLGGESQHYVAGSCTQIVELQQFTLAQFICYDLRFPEVFRAATQRGANLFTVIANWPAPRDKHWITLLQARAIENQAYVVGINRCGNDPQHAYLGHSMIIDPRGRVMAQAGSHEEMISAELDLQELMSYRQDFPFLRDIHVDYVMSEGK